MPTIATVQVFDFETFSGDSVNVNPANASGALITATLNYNQVNSITPQANLQAVRVSTLTDTTGRWQLNLIPNNNINPANTLWTISTPTQSYQISVPGSGPVQSSTIKVASPVTFSPASSTTGPLTVQGAFTVTGGPVSLPAGSVGVAALNGVLSIANGGTGSATQNWVDLSTAQTVGGAKTFSAALTSGGHLLATGTAPTLGALQTNVTAQSIGGNDVRGIVAITAGATGPATGSVVAVVTFASAFGITPIVVLTDQGNTATTGLFVARSVTTTGFTIMNSTAGVALTANVTYSIGYVVIG